MSTLKKSMMLLLFCMAGLGWSQLQDSEEQFMTAIQEVSQKYMPVLQTLEALALDGRMDEANQKLVNFIPESERTAVHNFMLGNFLYRIDRELSYGFHKKAYEMAPSISTTVLEWGMQQHRKGNYAEALKLYQSVEDKLLPQHYALLADCYINTGQPVKALQAWNMTDHKNNPTGVDYMIHGIYGEDIPQAQRNRLLPELAKKPERIKELLLLDLEWRSDWWSTGPNPDALAKDMPLFEKAFGAKDTAALRSSIALRTKKAAPAEFRAELEKQGLILNKGKLPESSLIAKILIEDVLKEELAKPETLLTDFHKELDYRGRKKLGDAEAWALLAELQLKVDPEKMEKIDHFGLLSYPTIEYLRRQMSRSLKSLDDPQLPAAIAQFPNHPFPRYSKMVMAEQAGKLTPDLIIDLIRIEFRGLNSNDFHSSGDLKAWFRKLEEAL